MGTPKYNLTQYEGNDIPKYIGAGTAYEDKTYNGDMAKIDRALGGLADSTGRFNVEVTPSIVEIADSAVVGTSTAHAKADHVHAVGTPAVATTVVPDASATTGISAIPARADHIHAIAAAAAISITPSTTNGAGSGNDFARANHTHTAGTAAPTTALTPSSTNTEGNASTYARSNHTHEVAYGTSAATFATGSHTHTPTTLDTTGLLNLVYPVNSIYISTVSTNPATLFGFGTWAAYAAGRTLIGVGTGTDASGQQQSFITDATGGFYKYRLSANELPPHTHGVSGGYPIMAWAGSGGNQGTTVGTNMTSVGGTGENTTTHSPHENLPPYIATYLWKRTA